MLDLWLAALLDSSLKGLALCLAAGAAILLLRRASAAARHLVWRLAFAGLLALPLLAALLPEWRVPVPGLARPAQTAEILPAAPPPVRASFDVPIARQETGPSPTLERQETVPAPRGWNLSWQAAAFGIWLAGALAVLGSLGIALLRVRWQERRARPILDEAWMALLGQVRAELGVHRPVALIAGGDRAMPMTWGWRRPVVLLPAGSEAWPESRRRAVLLHELAHIARGDFLTQLAAEMVRALYWLNPLVWMAARRLRMESEHACDDQVLAAGAQASDYAGDLLDIARSLRAVRAAAPAGLAMARPSQLTGRLLAVLDAHRDRRGIPRRLAVPAWLAAACVVLPLAAVAPAAEQGVKASTPGPAATASVAMSATSGAPQAAATVAQARSAAPQPPAPPRPPAPSGHSSSVSFSNDNDSVNISWSQDGHRIRIRTEGKVELNEDWTDIVRLSRGAEMRFEEEKDGTTRRLDVEPGKDGRPVYTWKVDGKERPFDAEGRKWLAGMLLQLVRGTGYAADERVAAILRKQGPEGVLAEISQIPSDYVKGIYFKKLLAHRDLGAAVVERSLRQAGQEIKSDYELANVLIAASQSQSLSDAAVTTYAEASRSIQSDYEQRRALAALLKGRRLTPANLTALLQAAHQIDSDYECAELLAAVAGQNRLDDPAAWRAFAAAADTIQSDYERHKALSAAVKSGLSPDALTGAIQSAKGINSDYERASLLVEIAGKYNLSGGARETYLEAARAIHSKYERERAEAALVERSGR